MISIAEAQRRAIELMIDELYEMRDARVEAGDPLGAENLQKEIAALELLLLPRMVH